MEYFLLHEICNGDDKNFDDAKKIESIKKYGLCSAKHLRDINTEERDNK